MTTDTFDYGAIPYETWKEFAAICGADDRHIKFAAAKFRNCTNTQAAREAGYGAKGGASTRSEGYRLARSNKINQLLALAAAEAGSGYDGTLTKQESRSILTAMARGSDPQVRIKSIELLNKLEQQEAAANAAQPEESLEQNLAALICSVTTEGVGGFLALEGFINNGGAICNYPLLIETAPLIAQWFPGEWQKLRIREGKHSWVLDFLDKAAASPVLEDAALIAAIKNKLPRVAKSTAKEIADNG
jgi:hypothetical protein